MAIEHLQNGPIVYDKVYLHIDKPVLFLAIFGKDRYIGVLYESNVIDDWYVDDYLFAHVPSDNVLHKLETGRMTLKELYNAYPCWQVNHATFDRGRSTTTWTYCQQVPELCVFNNETTLDLVI